MLKVDIVHGDGEPRSGSRCPRWLARWPHPASDDEILPDERLPPRDAGRELGWTPARDPELDGLGDALEIEAGNAALPAQPVTANVT